MCPSTRALATDIVGFSGRGAILPMEVGFGLIEAHARFALSSGGRRHLWEGGGQVSIGFVHATRPSRKEKCKS